MLGITSSKDTKLGKCSGFPSSLLLLFIESILLQTDLDKREHLHITLTRVNVIFLNWINNLFMALGI